jgi:CBS domain-containing protein
MRKVSAGDVMNTQVLTVRPDMTARELAGFLVENQISGAPVLDAHGKLVGVVSLTDIAESDAERTGAADAETAPHGWEGRVSAEEMRGLHVEGDGPLVADIMTPTVYAVPVDTPVALLARTMVSGRIHRLLVTRNHQVVGIVTSLDLLQLLCDDAVGAETVPAARRAPLAKD